MSLTPRLVAIHGIGFSAIELAVQGLIESGTTTPPPIILFQPGVGGGGGRGPDAQLSLSDYIKKFGQTSAMPAAVVPVHTPAQRAAIARKKRQRMEEEVLALADIF